MEQSTFSDSTRMPAAQVGRDYDDAREARITRLLTRSADLAPASETDLAQMVAAYFGNDPLHPQMTGDIALRDLARAILAAPVADPIFAAIEKDRALAAEHIRLLSISGSKPDDDPSWEPTHDASDAQWEHWREVLLKTVPTTATGCAALARYANEWVEREGVGLDEDGAKIFDLIGRSPLLTAPSGPEDALLLQIGQRWPQLKAAYNSLSERIGEIEEQFPEPEQPSELSVYPRFDLLHGFPPTKQVGERYAPYGKVQVEELRATPRVACYLKHPGPGCHREDGGIIAVDQPAQTRAEAIVAAWDRWQGEIAAYEAEHDLPALNAAFAAATRAYDEAARLARSIQARTPAGVLIKAKIAADLVLPADRDAKAVKAPADCQDAMLFSVLSDVLRIGGLPGYGIRETGASA